MTTRKPPTLKQLEKRRDELNKKFSVGDEVMLKKDFHDDLFPTKIRHPFSIMGGHSVVGWLEGVAGGYLETHIFAVQKREPITAGK